MNEYKRFLLFSFAEYYPGGGLGDVIESFDTEKEARDYIDQTTNFISEYAYIFDCQERITVWEKE